MTDVRGRARRWSRGVAGSTSITLPIVDGFTAAAELAGRLPACRTLILTSLGVPESLMRARAVGAWAFLTKDAPRRRANRLHP